MLITTRAVVLRVIEHGDSSVVLRAWTEHGGIRSYVVRSSKRRGTSAALLQPLNRLEIVAEEIAERDLHAIREARVGQPFVRIPFDPVRGAVAMFIQEVLNKVLRVEGPDEGLDGFIHESLETLDCSDNLRWFPHVFLIQLSGHLGFFPEAPRPGHDHFDLEEGCFIPSVPVHGHALAPPVSTALGELLDVGIDAFAHASPNPEAHRPLLDHLLLYYRMHIEGLGPWKSPEVLRAALS